MNQDGCVSAEGLHVSAPHTLRIMGFSCFSRSSSQLNHSREGGTDTAGVAGPTPPVTTAKHCSEEKEKLRILGNTQSVRLRVVKGLAWVSLA